MIKPSTIAFLPMKVLDQLEQYLQALFLFYLINLLLASVVLVTTAGISLTFPIAIRRVVDGFYSDSTQLMDYYFAAAFLLASLLAIGTSLSCLLYTSDAADE